MPGPSSSSSSTSKRPDMFATREQYPLTLDGTKAYLLDVHCLVLLLTPPMPPTAKNILARFIRLVHDSTRISFRPAGLTPNPENNGGRTSTQGNTTIPTTARPAPWTDPHASTIVRKDNRFYVLALGHFPELRRLILTAAQSRGDGSGNSITATTTDMASMTTGPSTELILEPPTPVQEHALCQYRAYRVEMGSDWYRFLPGARRDVGDAGAGGPEVGRGVRNESATARQARESLERVEKERVRDALVAELELLRLYMGRKRQPGIGPGSWVEVLRAANILAGLEENGPGLAWAFEVHEKFLRVDFLSDAKETWEHYIQ